MVDQVLATVRALPYLLPGLVVAILVGWAVRRWAGFGWAAVGWLVWAVLLTVLAVDPSGGTVRHACQLRRWVPLAPQHWFEASSDALNIWVFVVLGALAAWTSRPRLFLLLGAALPFAFEAIQSFLSRDCTSYDVANNLVGIVVGLCLGAGARLVVRGAHD